MPTNSITPAPSIPEDRIRAWLDAHRYYGGDDDLAYVDAIDRQLLVLSAQDLRDLLNEVVAWRGLAHERGARIAELSERLESYVDPVPQGEPITAGDD